MKLQRNISKDVDEAMTCFKRDDVWSGNDIMDLVLMKGDDVVQIRNAVYDKLWRLLKQKVILETGSKVKCIRGHGMWKLYRKNGGYIPATYRVGDRIVKRRGFTTILSPKGERMIKEMLKDKIHAINEQIRPMNICAPCTPDCFAKKIADEFVSMGNKYRELEQKFKDKLNDIEKSRFELTKIIDDKDRIITEKQMQIAELKKSKSVPDVKELFPESFRISPKYPTP